MTALRVGADLSHVFCTPEAGTAIKAYSPDIIVHPVLGGGEEDIAAVLEWLPRMDAMVIGPGMGRSKPVLLAASHIIKAAAALKVPTVIDGDALWLLSNDAEVGGLGLVSGSRWDGTPLVLTPNPMEFARLQAAVEKSAGGAKDEAGTLRQRIANTARRTAALTERMECRGKEVADSWRKRDALFLRGGDASAGDGGGDDASASAQGAERDTVPPPALRCPPLACDPGPYPSGSDCLDMARSLSGRVGGAADGGKESYASGLIVMQKGRRDVISDGRIVVLGPKPVEDGLVGLKRCGGQGDLLAGSLAVTLAWSVAKRGKGGGKHAAAAGAQQRGRKQSIGLGLTAPEPVLPWPLIACVAASNITRLSVATACKEAGEGGEWSRLRTRREVAGSAFTSTSDLPTPKVRGLVASDVLPKVARVAGRVVPCLPPSSSM